MISALQTDSSRTYAIGTRTFTLTSTSDDVLAACRAILHAKTFEPTAASALNVAVNAIPDGWQLEVEGRNVGGLANRTPIPLVAEKLIAIACSALATRSETILVNGVFLQHGDVRVAILGDDVDSAHVLGMHLQSRGWSLASFRSAFVARESLDFVGLQASLSLSSSSLDQIPPRFRPAVERSLWYDTGYDLKFYTVETPGFRVATAGPLTHVMIVDGDIDDNPSIDGPGELAQAGPLASHALVRTLRIARLTLGTPIASCGITERWLFGDQR